MEKMMLNITVWVLFLGGLFGFVFALFKLFGGATAAEYGVMGIGGGFWIISSALAILIRKKVQ